MANRDVTPLAMSKFLISGTGPMTTTGVIAGGYFATKYAKAQPGPIWPDIQHSLIGLGVFGAFSKQLSRAINVPTSTLDKYFQGAYGKDGFFIINLLSRSASRGTIELSSPDPNDYPLIYPNYFEKDIDMKVLIEGK